MLHHSKGRDMKNEKEIYLRSSSILSIAAL